MTNAELKKQIEEHVEELKIENFEMPSTNAELSKALKNLKQLKANADAGASSENTEAGTAESTEDSNSEGNDSKETTETSEEPPAPEASTEESGQPPAKEKKAKGYVMAKGRALIIGGRNFSEGMPITAKNCKDKKEFDKFVKGGYIVKA